MRRRISAWLLLSLFSLSGCHYGVHETVDATLCDLSAQPRDPTPPAYLVLPDATGADSGVRQTGHQEIGPQPRKDPRPDPKDPKKGIPALEVPPDLSFGEPIRLPPIRPGNEAEREKVINRYFPALEPLGPETVPMPGPDGHPLTLTELQRLALSNSPQVKEAIANVEAARGAALQAGLPPNPNISYLADTMGTAGGAGYQGGGIEQVIKVANKLQLARAAAAMDLRNAETALRRAESDQRTRVRSNYFAVLVAAENVRISRALATFTDEVYARQVAILRKGSAAAYEAMQLRATAVLARSALVQARHRSVSAWKQLAAALNLPGMPPTQLDGSATMPYPLFDHAEILDHALARHTDVLTAENGIFKARFNLQLARVQPYPDVDLQVILQKDRTGPPFNITPSVHLSIPIPIWDRNQGGIIQAEGNLANAEEEPHRVRAALTTTLAEAFERYSNNRSLLKFYREQILPDQVRAFPLIYRRYQVQIPALEASTPDFNAVVTTQQTLVTSFATYLTTLAAFWQSVADVADVMQTNDLYAACPLSEPIPLLPLPCCHSCSPVSDPDWYGAAGGWHVNEPGHVLIPLPRIEEDKKPGDKSEGKEEVKSAPIVEVKPASRSVKLPDIKTLPIPKPIPKEQPVRKPAEKVQEKPKEPIKDVFDPRLLEPPPALMGSGLPNH